MRGALVLLIAVFLAACSATTEVLVSASASLSVDSMTVPWRGTAKATLNGNAAGVPVAWSVADKSIASVDTLGVVTGKRGGVTTLTATVGGANASAVIRVEARFTGFAAGAQQTCGLIASGEVDCWGANGRGYVLWAAPPFYVAVTGGGADDGLLCDTTCWPNPSLSTQRGGFFCGLTTAGRVDCWGASALGQRGEALDRLRDSISLPVPAVAVRAGIGHACALSADGSAFCWGLNSTGQLGVSSSVFCRPRLVCSTKAVATQPALRFRSIAPGFQATCGELLDGSSVCWGLGLLPANGGKVVGPATYAIPIPAGAHGLTLGSWHGCALDPAGVAYCWGMSDHGQLGTGVIDSTWRAPSPVGGTLRFTSIVARADATCGVTVAKQVYCWGANQSGQLGDGTTIDRAAPVRVLLDEAAIDVTMSDKHSCAMSATRELWCWGAGESGQLGNQSTFGSTIPIKATTPLLDPFPE